MSVDHGGLAQGGLKKSKKFTNRGGCGHHGHLAVNQLITGHIHLILRYAFLPDSLQIVLHFLYYIFGIHRILDRYVWWLVGEVVMACAWLIALGILLTMLLCIVRALEGERFKIPILGDWADRI